MSLRPVEAGDIEVFYEFQADPTATSMASSTARDWDAHVSHWDRIRSDLGVDLRTVLVDGSVAGNLACFGPAGSREVGFWIPREWWGHGVASTALALFVAELERPLYAHVAPHNTGSARVLEKCGFVPMEGSAFEEAESDDLLFHLP